MDGDDSTSNESEGGSRRLKPSAPGSHAGGINNVDFYEVLGVGEKATADAIADAYLKKRERYRSDQDSSDPLGPHIVSYLDHAYAVLIDPERRRAHDAVLSNGNGIPPMGSLEQLTSPKGPSNTSRIDGASAVFDATASDAARAGEGHTDSPQRGAIPQGDTEQITSVESPPERRGWSLRRVRTFQTIFEVPAFRWYLLSMTGNWSALQMQMIARGFLTYQITGSFAALGTVELANTLPRLIFALTGGVVADRSNRRTITQIGQAISAVIATVLATLLFLGMLRFEHLVIAAVLQGIANSFALPARQAMIPEIVGMQRLTNALALNVSLMSTLRLGAPAFAGFLIAVAGASWVFTLMAVLYVFSTLTLFKVSLNRDPEAVGSATAQVASPPSAPQTTATPQRRSAVADIKDALIYLWQLPILRMLLIVDMFLGMLTFPYQRLLPGFVTEILANNPEETAIRMGILLTVTGVGALFGSLLIASLPNKHRGKLVIGSVALFAVGLLAFSASTVFLVSVGIVLIMGIGQSGRQALNNILIQSSTSNEFRGRISSIMLFEDGIESLGIFAIAILASVVGPQIALGATALTLLTLAASMWFLMPSYRRLQ